MREVSGRSEGGVENRPPSSKPLCTQVFSEIEGGLDLKMKNSCFSRFRASPKEGKSKSDIREFHKRPIYFHERPVYFHKRHVFHERRVYCHGLTQTENEIVYRTFTSLL